MLAGWRPGAGLISGPGHASSGFSSSAARGSPRLFRQISHTVGALAGRQRDRAAARRERAEALVAELDIEVLVEQAPPQQNGFASQLGRNLVDDAVDGDARIDADLAAFRFAREGAEPLSYAQSGERQRRAGVSTSLRRANAARAGRCSGRDNGAARGWPRLRFPARGSAQPSRVDHTCLNTIRSVLYCARRYCRICSGHRTGQQTAAPPSVFSPGQPQEPSPMKTLIASTLVALGLLASAAGAAPYDVTSRSDVPQWAQKAFAGSGH
jgi:hypothetical protein